MICKKCGKDFHYCSSCSENLCNDKEYCSDECMYESDEFKLKEENFKKFIVSLNKESYELFAAWYSEYDDNLDYLYSKWLNESYKLDEYLK